MFVAAIFYVYKSPVTKFTMSHSELFTSKDFEEIPQLKTVF